MVIKTCLMPIQFELIVYSSSHKSCSRGLLTFLRSFSFSGNCTSKSREFNISKNDNGKNSTDSIRKRVANPCFCSSAMNCELLPFGRRLPLIRLTILCDANSYSYGMTFPSRLSPLTVTYVEYTA